MREQPSHYVERLESCYLSGNHLCPYRKKRKGDENGKLGANDKVHKKEGDHLVLAELTKIRKDTDTWLSERIG